MPYLNSMRKVKGKGIEEEIQNVRLVSHTCSKENLLTYISQERIISQKLKVLSVQGRKISIDLNSLINLIKKSNQREDKSRLFIKTIKTIPLSLSPIFDNLFSHLLHHLLHSIFNIDEFSIIWMVIWFDRL